ncbi:hypothetical protein RB598_000192 [Gaeumannomyces tritici]
MADTDLIARVYPYAVGSRENVPGKTLEAFKTSWGCFDPLDQLPERQSRESTEPLETQNGPVLDTLPYVELKLSDTHRSRSGFLFGWGQNNDVVLPKIRGVGRHHFTLTFDGEKRPIVKDWGSLNGTQVTYGSQGHGARSGFQWIVGGHEIPFVKRPIVVAALARPLVRLQIVVVPHDVASLAYIDKVDRFLQSTAAATEDLLSGLNIANRTDTKRPTGAPKLETGPIHIRKQLGKGSFASVTRYWDVSTGEEYALKKPSAEAVRARRVRIDAWRNEAHIMNLIEHPHVVKLHRSDFTQGPRLYLEYVPGGSLADKDISAAQCVSILQQCLSALEYLHGSDPPIVHRDIKADNILVQYRDKNSIYVKFADFGLAKDYDNMSTICGNLGNLAPEVYENHQYIEAGGKGRVSYTEAVDVWSLGVTVYTFLCPLPRFENQYISRGTAWAKELIKMFNEDLEERPDELRRFLLEAMVVLRPEQRWSAGDCLARAMLLPVVPAMDQPETAAAVSYVGGDERSTIRYGAEPGMVQGREMPMWQPGSSENSTLSTDAGRYDRSGAPTLSTDAGRYDRSDAPTPRASVPASAFSRKRATVPRSLSSGRHRKRREHGSSSSSSSSSSSKADAGSRQQRDRVLDNRTHDSLPRQQRDRVLDNRTQDSLPPVAFEDKDEDEDDWEREEDDNARVESPHAVDHVSTSHVGQEVESYMQTFLQHQVDNGGADQEAADAAVMFQRLNRHGITIPFESMARTSGEAATSTIASSYGERDAQGGGPSHFPGNYILAPPRQDGGGGQNNSAGVDHPCGDDPTGPASQVDSQPRGLFSSGDPLNPLLVGSFVAAWGGGGAGEESTAGTAPSHASVVEEEEDDDDLPPPWSPAHPQLATHSSVVVAHPHFPPSLAEEEEEVEENGDRPTGHFTEPAPYVGHPYSAYGLGDNDQLLDDDDLDEGTTAEGHEEADGGDGGYALQPEGEAEAGPAQVVQRRKRTSYSAAHKAILEAAFRNNPKPETRKYCELATQLSTEMRRVQVWFQNRRQRERRETKRDVGLLQC